MTSSSLAHDPRTVICSLLGEDRDREISVGYRIDEFPFVLIINCYQEKGFTVVV